MDGWTDEWMEGMNGAVWLVGCLAYTHTQGRCIPHPQPMSPLSRFAGFVGKCSIPIPKRRRPAETAKGCDTDEE